MRPMKWLIFSAASAKRPHSLWGFTWRATGLDLRAWRKLSLCAQKDCLNLFAPNDDGDPFVPTSFLCYVIGVAVRMADIGGTLIVAQHPGTKFAIASPNSTNFERTDLAFRKMEPASVEYSHRFSHRSVRCRGERARNDATNPLTQCRLKSKIVQQPMAQKVFFNEVKDLSHAD